MTTAGRGGEHAELTALACAMMLERVNYLISIGVRLLQTKRRTDSPTLSTPPSTRRSRPGCGASRPSSRAVAGRTGGTLNTSIAVLAALAGSLVFGVSSVAEQRGTQRVERRPPPRPGLLLELIRQPLWLTGVGATLIGFTLQVVALTYGPLALVDPILISDLIIASLIASALRKRWDSVMIAGVGAAAAGLARSWPSPGRQAAGRPSVCSP